MDFAWFLPLLGFALITCGTPGPNNMLLTAAGANLGFRASMPTLVAVVSGLNLIMLATALGLGVVFASQPMLHQGLARQQQLKTDQLVRLMALTGLPLISLDTSGHHLAHLITALGGTQ